MSAKVQKITLACLTCGKDVVHTPKRIASGRGKFCSRSCHGVARETKHGHAVDGAVSPTYTTWCGMVARCTSPGATKYYAYGAVGITVCDEWLTFSGFLADMGERPKGTTLDRIDGTLGYSARNCRWATSAEQMANLRTNTWVMFDGNRVQLSALSRELGIKKTTLIYRIKQGWTTERIRGAPLGRPLNFPSE